MAYHQTKLEISSSMLWRDMNHRQPSSAAEAKLWKLLSLPAVLAYSCLRCPSRCSRIASWMLGCTYSKHLLTETLIQSGYAASNRQNLLVPGPSRDSCPRCPGPPPRTIVPGRDGLGHLSRAPATPRDTPRDTVNSAGLKPRRFGLEPRRFGLEPRSFGLEPRRLGLEPRRFGLEPRRFGLEPRSFGLKPRRFGLEPRRFGLEPRRFGLKPRRFGLEPRRFGLEP